MTWAQNQPGYPSIFDASNCSLISQLIPPGPKKFLQEFMDGNLLRNPVQQVAELLQGDIGKSLGQLESIQALSSGFSGLADAAGDLSDVLGRTNTELQAFTAHTNRLSGVDLGDPNSVLPRLDQIIGVMSTYNSIKDLLKDPGQKLEDNFSNAFSSLNPQITGPFFENFGQNMSQISTVLSSIEAQLAAGGLTDLASDVGKIRQLTDNIVQLESTMQSLINGDINAYNAALAFVERYALGNTIISSVLSDPCFGAQLVTNLITTEDASKALKDIANESGVKVENAPVNLLDYIPSLND
jgi:hypothetical protein